MIIYKDEPMLTNNIPFICNTCLKDRKALSIIKLNKTDLCLITGKKFYPLLIHNIYGKAIKTLISTDIAILYNSCQLCLKNLSLSASKKSAVKYVSNNKIYHNHKKPSPASGNLHKLSTYCILDKKFDSSLIRTILNNLPHSKIVSIKKNNLFSIYYILLSSKQIYPLFTIKNQKSKINIYNIKNLINLSYYRKFSNR
uniref:RNA binding protein n=1 Tax=Amorphochlora amoebiformis TaxID=1561963 RepID=A0A0H5BI99_9EUKA|nr:RNA binding protein [Amorphochlora amoebiformis]